jgi:hypothetical protein
MRRCLFVALSLLAGCVTLEPVPVEVAAPAYAAPAGDLVITPTWADRAPSAQDIVAVYPLDALGQGVEGLVHLRCKVLESRHLDCGVESDFTPGYGFGAAALSVAQLFVVKENYPRAAPGADIRLPIRFQVSD